MIWLLRLLPYIVGLGAVAFAHNWAWQDGYDARDTEAQVERVEHVRRAIEQEREVRAIEQEMQNETNATLRRQADDLAAINTRLAADLERLQLRPDRADDLPEAPRADCAGATGAELSGPDAAFLTREAARADRLRAALRACYEYADTVSR